MNSAYGHFKTWKMLKVIVKSGDDLRSEQFAMQLIETIDLIFKKRKLKLKL
jgi:phosphatidylinositol 4-kinase